jgi:hypothetical protein
VLFGKYRNTYQSLFCTKYLEKNMMEIDYMDN